MEDWPRGEFGVIGEGSVLHCWLDDDGDDGGGDDDDDGGGGDNIT